MAGFSEDKKRLIIPRWREFHTTLNLNELTSLSQQVNPQLSAETVFSERLRDWQNFHSFSFAADLVSCSIVLSREPEAQDAAKFILLEQHPHFEPARALARHALGLDRSDFTPDELGNTNELEASYAYKKIHSLRERLNEQPRNSLLWVDLSRIYAISGFPEQAKRSMDIALKLTPENRFVLRSAARLFLHLHDPSYAHDILRKSERVRYDPWILASEIAVATASGLTSRLIKFAKAIIKSQKYEPFHMSELASALGTLEMESGDLRRARRFLRTSLEKPNENATAQASWAARSSSQLQLDDIIKVYRKISHEALSWFYYYQGDWKEATNEIRRWFFDQPFSSQPAIFGSFLWSTIFENFDESVKIAKKGLLANPNNFLLLNNFSFAVASANQVGEAQKYFNRIETTSLSQSENIIWLATKGFLSYRTGNSKLGRQLYLQSISNARRINNRRLEALAAIHIAFEELRAATPEAENYRLEALTISENLQQYPDIVILRERLSKYSAIK